MTNLSSLSKAFTAIVAAGAIAVAAQLAMYLHAPMWLQVLLTLLLIATLMAGALYVKRVGSLLLRIDAMMHGFTKGDLEGRIIGAGEKGDLKRLVDNMNNLVDISDAFVREARVAMEFAAQGKFYRKVVRVGMNGNYAQAADVLNNSIDLMADKSTALQRMGDELESRVVGIVGSVASAATQLSRTADEMGGQVHDASNKSSQVADASSQAMGNVNSVASAVEEMSASVQEISHQMQRVKGVVDESADKSSAATKQAQRLQEASQSIGDMAQLIEDIAGQINLLALNATIESARAGEAGRGFAVVAGEVKNLASQTANATEEITKEIQNIQAVALSVADALSAIGDAVNEMNLSSTAVASAVEEQTAVNNEISSNMQTTSMQVQQVGSNIADITGAVQQVDGATSQVRDAAATLSQQAESLNGEIQGFLERLRQPAA